MHDKVNQATVHMSKYSRLLYTCKFLYILWQGAAGCWLTDDLQQTAWETLFKYQDVHKAS